MRGKKRLGRVVLVGAGPGDPSLLTLRGEEMLRGADAVVYDWLVNPEILKLAPRAEKVFVGKKGGTHYKEQADIHQILLRLARKGKFVVRLKGGDPFIFGRGGEEAGFLAQRKIPFEIVPGVSAGIGVPAYAGIPLTDRRFASQVTFITGHEDPTQKKSMNWKKLGGTTGTLVFFMGFQNLPEIVDCLLKNGRPRKTPIAVIEWGTLPRQRVLTGTLGDILGKIRKEKIESPALTIIGEVVRLRRKLAWFEKRPLSGKTVLVTRARAQASRLVRKLEEQGAQVIEFPTIELLPPSRPERLDLEIRQISRYDWIVFTSANGVESFFGRMEKMGKDARIFSRSRIAAIGEATAQALWERSLKADLVPKEFTSLSLFHSLKETGEIRGKKFLLARADIAPPDLKEALEKEGARVVEVETYRTRPVAGERKELLKALRDQKVDYVTFTSSSTVQNFFEAIPPLLRRRIRSNLVSIGPVTSQTLRRYGVKPSREAQVHTIEGLVDALINGAGGEGKR